MYMFPMHNRKLYDMGELESNNNNKWEYDITT